MAKQHGVGLGIVREAVTRLAEQGLVVAEPQLGFRVPLLSLADLTSVRVDIETLALRRSIAHGGLAWVSRVVAARHIVERVRKTRVDGRGRHLTVACSRRDSGGFARRGCDEGLPCDDLRQTGEPLVAVVGNRGAGDVQSSGQYRGVQPVAAARAQDVGHARGG
ncbi:regulatory protein, gntR family [Actinokineospora iranica]|uniref:Regulatory protein, gntR family n=1 Tax=Actinokineospora iranica TaxID=1271860 RepID=A0A1G6J1R0_9PSEU|nr:regulatory protein, gntR family [Actinokineospora iranica]